MTYKNIYVLLHIIVELILSHTLREKIHERCKNICPNKDDLSVPNITNNHDKAKEELEQVPKIFMRPDFVLNDPATFNTVLPWSHFSVAGGKNSRDGASSRLLQEKLSHYLDVVEVSIARQISLRSEAFFHAMSSQHELQDRLRETAVAVATLRARTAVMDRVMCRGPLQALKDTVTRSNCTKLHGKLKLMAAVQQTQPTVQLLLSTSEFVGALELIATTKEVLQQELQGIHSFRHLGSQLCEMEKLIDKMIVADFTTYSRSDLNRSFEDDSQVLEKDRLQSLVFGLLRQRKLDFLDIYSEEMMQAAKGIVRQCVLRSVSQIEDIDTDTVVKLQDQMRLMKFSQWFELLQNVFEHFVLFLTRIKATLSVIRNVVLEVLDSCQRSRMADSSSAIADGNCGENEDEDEEDSGGSSLRPGEAELAYLTHEGLFISDALNEAERRSSTAAPSKTQTQTRAETSGSDSASGTTESSSSREQTTNTTSSLPTGGTTSIVYITTKLPRSSHQQLEQSVVTKQWQDCSVPHHKSVISHQEKPSDFLLVDGQKYAVVGTVLLLIRIFLEYCQCVNDIPSITTDMLTRLADLLKHFNSRSCQLVLGAGALQVVGLKTITTKNLALVSRCLQLVVHYIPIIRAHFETKLQPKQYSILRHFDHITKDYNDHIAEISAKLVAIMDGLFERVLSKYEVKAPMPSLCFRNVCKQMAKMHEAIHDLLPEEQTQMLFLRINTSFKMHLKRQLSRLGVINDGGPQHGLVVVDVAFYTENVQALRSLERLDLNMPEIWEQKR
uniref:Vacuolar protein sorting-associated protein 54 n=1 Tax=Astyanax mexicanus TaxID=7994 RepID=A0A8B9HX59_ASTMX